MDAGRLYKILLILLVLLAVGLRLLRLDWQPLWWDEGYTFYASTMSMENMIRETAEDIHPPLYYALLHIWQVFLGVSPFAARLFSVVVGVASVALVIQIGQRLAGFPLAALAGFITAISPFQVYYSQEIRMYALTALLGLTSTWLMWLWLEGASQRTGRSLVNGRLIGYVFLMTAGLYTHYYTALILLAHAVFLLLTSQEKRAKRAWFIAGGTVIAAYVPWVAFSASKLASYIQGKVSIERYTSLGPLAYVLDHLCAFSLGHLPVDFAWLYLGAVLFVALAGVAIVGTRQVAHRGTELHSLALLVVIAILGAFLINLLWPFHPRGYERLILFAATAFDLLVAMGCTYLWRRVRVLAVTSLAFVAMMSGLALYSYYQTPRYVQDDYRPLIDLVRIWGQSGDAVLCLYPWQIGYFRAYHGDTLTLDAAFKQDWPSRYDNPTLLPTYLDRLMSQYRRIWFPAHQIGGRILETEMQSYLAEHYHTLISTWANRDTQLWLFSAAGDLAPAASGIRFGNVVVLTGSALSQGPVSAGSACNVALFWQRTGSVGASFYTGLRLVDETGYTWAQRSAEPLAGLRTMSEWRFGETVPDRQGLLIPPDIPPGRYWVKLGLYQRDNHRGLDVIGPNGTPTGVEATLGTVDIVLPSSRPDVRRVELQTPLTVDFRDKSGSLLRLLGYTLLTREAEPGNALDVTLFWLPLSAPVEALPVLRLVDESHRIVASAELSTTLARYSPSRWPVGYPVRDPRRLIVPPTAAAGSHRLQLASTNGNTLDIGEVRVAGGRAHDMTPPDVPHRFEATFGSEIRLLGYGLLPPRVAPGSKIDLTLYWQALQSMHTSYTMFVHLLDSDQHIWGQVDTLPGSGTLPTTGWLPGEFLRDTYSFQVKPDTPPGRYRIELGLYDAATGVRCPVRSGNATDDHVILPQDIIVTVS